MASQQTHKRRMDDLPARVQEAGRKRIRLSDWYVSSATELESAAPVDGGRVTASVAPGNVMPGIPDENTHARKAQDSPVAPGGVVPSVQGAASPVAPGTPEGDRAADPPTEVVALASNPANLTQPPKLKFSVEFDAPGEDDTKVIVMFGGLRFKRATDRYFALLPHLDAAGGFIRHRDNHVITGDAGTMAVQDMGFMLNGDTLTYVPPAQLRYVCTGEEVPPMPVWRLLGLNDVGKPLVCRDPRGARAGGSEVVSGGADMRIVVHGRLEDAGATVRVRGSTVLRAVLEAIMARFPGLPSSQCFRRLGGSNALMFEMGKTVMELGIEDGQAFQYPAQGL